jgi:membrane fusion protein (multidrug efflux system)
LLSEAKAQVESASAEKQRATAEFENARAEAERGEKLIVEQVLSPQELSALKSRVSVFEAQVGAAEAQQAAAHSRVQLYQEQLQQAELRAPFDGAVGRRYLDVGATVAPGSQVLRLVKGGPLEVRFRASEVHVSRLETGTALQITTLGTGARVFAGELLRVSAEVSRTDRSVEVEGQLKEVYPELRPGMYATVRASLGTLENATLVPSHAMLSKISPDGSTERGVFTTDGKKAHYKALEVLGEYQGKAAVRGVLPGARVVVQGQDLLTDGAAVRLTQEKSQ